MHTNSFWRHGAKHKSSTPQSYPAEWADILTGISGSGAGRKEAEEGRNSKSNRSSMNTKLSEIVEKGKEISSIFVKIFLCLFKDI